MKEAALCRPEFERYTAVKMVALIGKVYGKRGRFLYNLSTYLRQLDDFADEPGKNMAEKITFMLHEMGKIEQEEFPVDFPQDLKDAKQQIYRSTLIEMSAIKDDVEHQGLKARSLREIRHYYWRTLAPCMSGLLMVINGKYPKETRKYMEWIQGAMLLGSLEDLEQDVLEQEVQKVPLRGNLPDRLNPDDILMEYSGDKFKEVKRQCVKTMILNVGCFWEMDIPTWQKLVCTLYTFESAIKRGVLVKPPKTNHSIT